MLSTMVLTAGLGTRLDPLTRLVAKPAVPLGDSTLIEQVLGWLARHGIKSAVLNLHARPESIARVVGDGTHLGMSVRYSWEHPLLGSAGGPRHALPLLDRDAILLVNGDGLCEVDIGAMLDQHRASKALATMAVVPHPAPDRYGGLRVDSQGRVTGVEPRGSADVWHFVGVQIVERDVLAGLPDNVRAETVSGLYRERFRDPSGPIRAFTATEAFLDVGTPEFYFETALRLGGRSVPRPTVVAWPASRIDPAAKLDRCIVAGAVHVPAGLSAQDKVIVPAAVCRASDAAEVVGDLALFPFAPVTA